jgi:hypothetical protein
MFHYSLFSLYAVQQFIEVLLSATAGGLDGYWGKEFCLFALSKRVTSTAVLLLGLLGSWG